MPTVIKRSRFELWQDVIFALLVRKLSSKFNDKFGVSWLIVQPVLFISLLSMLRGRLGGNEVHGIPVFVFMLFGMTTILQFLSGWTAVSRSIHRDRPLYAFRQVLPLASVASEVLIELVTFIIVLIILFVIALLIGLNLQFDNLLGVVFYLIEIQVLSYGLGLIFAVLNSFVGEIAKLQRLMQKPMIFISGAFFTLSDLPEEAWPYLTWNPVLHAVELVRGSAYQSFPVVPVVSPTYLHITTLSILFLGLALYFVNWKRMISR